MHGGVAMVPTADLMTRGEVMPAMAQLPARVIRIAALMVATNACHVLAMVAGVASVFIMRVGVDREAIGQLRCVLLLTTGRSAHRCRRGLGPSRKNPGFFNGLKSFLLLCQLLFLIYFLGIGFLITSKKQQNQDKKT